MILIYFQTAKEPAKVCRKRRKSTVLKADICPVCNSGETIESTVWYGCNSCPRWFHRDCLPAQDRATADLSVMLETDYVCFLCFEKAASMTPTCVECKEPKSSIMAKWLVCTRCHDGYHSSCLPDSVYVVVAGRRWCCPKCRPEA